jgi:hypothetical protein
VGAAVLAAVILVVPSLVRATQAFDPGAASAPMRLNRGFDAPEAKCDVTPPDNAPLLRSVVTEAPETASFALTSLAVEKPLADSPPGFSPDPLRGPPLAHFA